MKQVHHHRDFARDPAVLPPKAPDLTVAQTILQQLGGRQFIAMTGAKDFIGGPKTLSFKIPKTRGVRGVRITLTPADTYTVECYTWGERGQPARSKARNKGQRFSRLVKGGGGHFGAIDTVATFEDVYHDQLRDIFTQATGLRTSLGTRGR